MANTYTSLHYHIVFSTKNREPWLREDVRARLWPYLGGISRENKLKAMMIGGVADHVHLVVSIPPSVSVSKAIQLIKGGSSHWLKENFPELVQYAWQDGYAAFSVSRSQLDSVAAYVAGQEEHHRKKTFAEEYRAFLSRHEIVFDERYVLG